MEAFIDWLDSPGAGILLGSMIGAGGAIAGGLLSQRRQFIRDARVRILEDYLSHLQDWVPREWWTGEEEALKDLSWRGAYPHVEAIRRISETIGRRDASQALLVAAAIEDIRRVEISALETMDARQPTITPAMKQRHLEAKMRLARSIGAYENWLKQRIL